MGYWNRIAQEGRKTVAQEAKVNRELYKVYLKIVDHVRAFQAAADFSQGAYRAWDLTKYLQGRGYNIVFNNCMELGSTYGRVPFAGVNPPTIDKNNPLIANFKRQMYQGNGDLETFSNYVREHQLQGTVGVDMTLAGDLSKVPVTLYLSAPLFAKLTAEEVAAVMLHELGHVYFYFRYIVRTLVSNGVADMVSREFMKIEDKTQRLKLIKDVEKVTRSTIGNQENLIEDYRKETVYQHVVHEMLLDRDEIVGGEAMAGRTWERLADHYVGLHGASDHLATALYKLETGGGWLFMQRAYVGYAAFYLIEVSSAFILTAAALVSPVNAVAIAAGLALGMHLNDTADSIYDEPEERYQTMRRALVARLKDIEQGSGPDTADLRSKTLQSIAVLDELLSKVNDKDDLNAFIQKNWLPSGRRNAAAVAYQHDLEAYLNNDLTVFSSKLKGKL